MRIGIVGLGLAGATLGAALVKRGLKVSLFEQASEIREVGAGVFLWPNAVRGLIGLGLGPKLAEIGCEAKSPIRTDQGELIQQVRTEMSDGPPSYQVHRAELLNLISDMIPREDIHLGRRCVGSEEAETEVTLQFEDGGRETFDVVVGADGIRSVLLGAVTEPSEPVFANLAMYRGLIPNDPDLELGHGGMWTDRRKYFLAFPVSGGRTLNFVGSVPVEGKPEESWFQQGTREELAAEFVGWDPRVRQIIDRITETFRWGLYTRPRLPTIISRRIALVGDAAHPMLPMAGQGANQAIEDSIGLAVLLADASSANVPERLKMYEDLRFDHATAVQTMSRRNAQFMHAAVPLQPGEERPDKAGETDWVISYDVEKEAERVLANARQA